MNLSRIRQCRPGEPRQAFQRGTAENDGNKHQQRAATATPIVPFLPGARQAVVPLCAVCQYPLALPYVVTRAGLVHLRCLTAERQVAA